MRQRKSALDCNPGGMKAFAEKSPCSPRQEARVCKEKFFFRRSNARMLLKTKGGYQGLFSEAGMYLKTKEMFA